MTVKKNSGCINCEHYEYKEGYSCAGCWYDSEENCNNKSLRVCGKKEIDPINGERDLILFVTPRGFNKNLTCKGFTPIDWKKRYDELKESQLDPSLYVSAEDYGVKCELVHDFRKGLKAKNISIMALFFVIIVMSGFIMHMAIN